MNGGMYRPPSDRFGGNADTMKAATTEGVQRIADAAERQAAALEGLLALLTARLPDLVAAFAAEQAAAAPADAFDAMMGDPLAALGRLTPFAAPAADPGDEDQGDDYTPRIRWSKLDPRSRELARLRTDAKHRAAAAKSPDQRAAALRDYRQAKSEASRRQTALRELFAEDLIDIVKGELVVYVDPCVHIKWRSEYLPAPDYILTFPK
jgi:hypothetical protein